MSAPDQPIESPSKPGGLCEAALSYLRGLIDSDGARSETPMSAVRDQLLTMAAAWRPAQAMPSDLVGRACPASPPDWHLQKLIEFSDRARPDREADGARRLYHARWLGHLLMPERAEFRPLVTILIPVYNRAAMAVEAVESCLAQTWRPLEILVVDDGSTDNLTEALARYRGVVRLERQPNGGVSRARNLGIRRAQGDFIHFLDSDNLLLPMAVSRKVDAFARFPDAELCYSLAEITGKRTLDLPNLPPPDSSADCPTTSLLDCSLRHPFYISCVMLPRFTLLDAGGFEEDLRRGEDTRFWVKLGLRGTKVVGLAAELTVRRLSSQSLSAEPLQRSLHLAITARTIADLLGDRNAWRLAARGFPGLLSIVIKDDPSQSLKTARRDISNLLASIGAVGGLDGPSPLPLLVFIRHLIKRAIELRRKIDKESAALLKELYAATDAAARRAAPLTAQDVSYWARTAVTKTGKSRLNSFLNDAQSLLRKNSSSLPAVDELLRHAPIIPTKGTIRKYVRLRRKMLPRQIALPIALRHAG